MVRNYPYMRTVRNREPAVRTAAKTATYSMMHLTVAIAVAYALTRNWKVALAVGLIEPVFQTAAFALHEHLWSRAGKKKAAAASATAASATSWIEKGA
jgi:uncharacterized membrane protein